LRRVRGSKRLCSVGLWRIFGRRVIGYTLYFFCCLPILSGPALRFCWQFISVYTIRISSSILLHHISSMPLIVTSKKILSRRLQVFAPTIDQSRIAHAHTARAQAAVRGTGHGTGGSAAHKPDKVQDTVAKHSRRRLCWSMCLSVIKSFDHVM
jgi:hypothetical protein